MLPGQEVIARSDVWFEDGNIVIQAEQTQFKIHRGVLAAQSSVFQGMFSLPQPPSGEEEAVEGCPVVHVSDSATDIAIALRALFLRGYVSGDPLPITVVAAFLRIGTKYEIEIIRTEGLKRLLYEYPSSLPDYDEMDPWSRIVCTQWVNIDVANLAREQTLLSVLPTALYLTCAVQDAQSLISGRPRGDGTIAMISPTDLNSCLIARESLAKLQKRTTFAWIDPSSSTYPSCETPQNCLKFRMQVMAVLLFPPHNICGLEPWHRNHAVKVPVNDMCTRCQEVAEKLHNDGRVEFWNKLPGMFGLPKWAEIHKELAEFAW